MTDSLDPEQRVTQLEETVAFQQRTIDHLNEVLIDVRADLDRLSKGLDQQQARVKWLTQNLSHGEDIPNEKPPHY